MRESVRTCSSYSACSETERTRRNWASAFMRATMLNSLTFPEAEPEDDARDKGRSSEDGLRCSCSTPAAAILGCVFAGKFCVVSAPCGLGVPGVGNGEGNRSP